jgi:hypothetical protein
MPSEERVEIALKALSTPIEKYRSAVVTTAEEVRGFLATHRSDDASEDIAVAAELGGFAAGRIDMDRFANLLSDSREEEDPDTIRKVEKAFDILQRIGSDGDDAFYLKVKPGTRLRDAVAGRLSEIGRGFAAARIAGLAALGALTDGQAEELLEPLGFEAWNTGERQLAPPLVVELDGAALNAADLVDFLDGNVRLVLLVNGDAPPAPLVRLITPSAFVLQTTDAKDLDRFVAAEPPAVAALMPPGAARFVHDPSRGDLLRERLEIVDLPEKPPRRKLGGTSARQQKEELEQLRALAELTGATQEVEESAPVPATEAKSVDKLAAWLLAQTDLSDISKRE